LESAVEASSALFELATVYYACRDVDTLLKTFAARVGAAMGARAVLVWIEDGTGEALVCRGRWSEPSERFDTIKEGVAEGVLAEVYQDGETRSFSAKDNNPEELVHLLEASRARVKSALYVALPGAVRASGVVEVINRRAGEFTTDDASFLEEASRITAQALQNLQAIDGERQVQFSTLERLTSLYDLSRIFNSTLELEELLPIVAEKIRDILGAQACNLWLVSAEGNEISFAQQAGEDPTTQADARLPLGEGLLGQIAQQGKPQVIEDASQEELLAERLKAGGDFRMQTVMAAPLRKDEEIIGLVELVNKLDGSSFNEDDLFFLTSVCEQAAVALHNANLLESERKVQVLDALLTISREITSTLDLDHVLTTVVHQSATVVPYDRCVIGFVDRGRFILGAVSGEAQVPKTSEMDRLRDMLEWVSRQLDPVSADEYEESWQAEPEGAQERVTPYLKEYSYSGFYALPMRDEQGALGVLCFLSGDAEFLTSQQKETASILANQTAVALRNAQLYQQLPLGSFLKPLAEKKQRLMALPHARVLEFGWRVLLAALILTVVPWKMRVSTNATVVPAERRVVTAEISGVIQRVPVWEGKRVEKGEILAQLDDGEDRVKLAQAQSNLAQAKRDLADAEFHRDLAAAGQARLRTEMYQAEVNLEQERVEKSRLRAPISGIIVTPKVEEKTGKLLTSGEAFCELVDQERMAVEMNVPESEMALVQPGKMMALKLNAFPTSTFDGHVKRVSAETISAENEQFFVVRAEFSNPGGLACDGMAGRAKITAGGGWFNSGWYPIGYVFLRSPFHWAWQKAWLWLP
jgi:RND family efflux transporter MFP subunit